jgi:hypothetical protein
VAETNDPNQRYVRSFMVSLLFSPNTSRFHPHAKHTGDRSQPSPTDMMRPRAFLFPSVGDISFENFAG